MGEMRPMWEVVVECARELTARGVTPFTRVDLITCVQRHIPTAQRSSLDPIIQGLTANATGGPSSRGGQPLYRIARGKYVLREENRSSSSSGTVTTEGAPARRTDRWGVRRRDLVDRRLEELLEGFEGYLDVFDERVPFRLSGQYSLHRRVIEQRSEFAMVRDAVEHDPFVHAVWEVLQAWGIGRRGSRLAPLDEFRAAMRDRADDLAALDDLRLEDVETLDDVEEQVWRLAEGLRIVDNRARIVAGTKALHHLLPDLVPPMDRAWTGAFFGWTAQDPQNDQRRTFLESYRRFHTVARRARPSQFVGEGWRTCSTKVLDNALIGYCMVELT